MKNNWFKLLTVLFTVITFGGTVATSALMMSEATAMTASASHKKAKKHPKKKVKKAKKAKKSKKVTISQRFIDDADDLIGEYGFTFEGVQTQGKSVFLIESKKSGRTKTYYYFGAQKNERGLLIRQENYVGKKQVGKATQKIYAMIIGQDKRLTVMRKDTDTNQWLPQNAPMKVAKSISDFFTVK